MKRKLISKNVFGIFISLLFSLALFSGCKFKKEIDNNEHFGPIIFPGERMFTSAEVIIGRRICENFKLKRELFQNYNDKELKFRFLGNLADCQGLTTLESTFIASVGTAGSLQYISTTERANYFRDIVTDQSGPLLDICTSLKTTNNVSNTVHSGKTRYTVLFGIVDNFDRYDFKKEISDNSGKYTTTGAESLSVITNQGQGSESVMGMEKARTRYTSCPNGKFGPTMKQSWIEALPIN